jgi:rhomboid protease GluP
MTVEETDTIKEKKISERSPILTWLACAACVLIFIGISQETGTESWETMESWGYFSPISIWDGKYWALISSVFVHQQIWHVAFNVYWLWILGGAVEKTIGSLRYLIFFVLAAIVSSGAQFAASSSTGIGASGVLYALFGFMWIARDRYELFGNLLPKQTVVTFVVWLFLCIVATFLEVLNIGNEAHIAGLLFGAGTSAVFVLKYKAHIILVAEAFLLILAVVPLFWCPWSVTWVSNKGYNAHARGDYKSAVEWYQKSLRLGEEPKWVLSNLALSYLNLGDQTKYKETLEQLRKLDPKSAQELEEETMEEDKD